MSASLQEGILNLDDVVEKYAAEVYEKHERKDLEKSLGCKLPWSELRKEIDTKELLIYTTVPNYENSRKPPTEEPGNEEEEERTTTRIVNTNDILKPKSSNSCVFETVYTNGCPHDIVNTINTTRTTRATCTCRVTRGFVLNREFGIKLALPNDILEFNAGFSSELSVEKESEKTLETEMTWSINTEVRVPGCRDGDTPTKVSAKVVIREQEFNARFYAVTYLSGRLKVRLYRSGDSQQLTAVSIRTLRQVFKEELGFRLLPNNRVAYEVAGETHARFGVSQSVDIQPMCS